MTNPVNETEARLALTSIEVRRQQVVAEINVPRWYLLAMSGGWLVLGVLADYAPAWATAVGTFLFGAAHATVAPRVLSGRRASGRLSIRGDLVSRRVPMLVIGFLVAMTGATVGLALWFHADGTRHPATLASAVVAALVLSGGPNLMGFVRRHAERDVVGM